MNRDLERTWEEVVVG